MGEILLVEDNRFLGSYIKGKIESEMMMKVQWCQRFEDARDILEADPPLFHAAVTEFQLPDKSGDAVLELFSHRNIPFVVFTRHFNDSMRETVWKHRALDYILKDSADHFEEIIYSLKRIEKNRKMGVLLVCNEECQSNFAAGLLRAQQYKVYLSKNVPQTINILEDHDEIRMVIFLPDCISHDALSITDWVRSKYPKNEFALLALLNKDCEDIATLLIKQGLNDYIQAPFCRESFYCRISQNTKMIEQGVQLVNSSREDPLTGLLNRSYFDQASEPFFENAQRKNLSLVLAFFQIDRFDQIKNNWTIDGSHALLRQMGVFLKNRTRKSDLICRYEGETFALLASNMAEESIKGFFASLMKSVEQHPFSLDNEPVHMTISSGLCIKPSGSLPAMMQQAQLMLHEARKKGDNQMKVY